MVWAKMIRPHQAVEQLASLRLTPISAPGDRAIRWKRRWAGSWRLSATTTTALIFLSRQNLAQVERTPDQVKEIARGGYVLKDSGGKPDIILIATGSEMEITLQAAERLAERSQCSRSFPALDRYFRRPG
ncbi:transketolase-like TK C-terminal-containing protein [Escherichia coli]